MITTRPLAPSGSPKTVWTDPAPAEIRLDRLAARLLGAPMTVAIVALAALQVACWLPHYLTWPWWSDHDVFATMARAWDAGLLPYRDVVGNNFPGTIYLFWSVGRLAGWSNTAAFYAVDAALLIGFGLALLGWSRRRFGRALPGAVGLLAVLAYYLEQDYTQAAQRDWQGPLLAALGLMAAEAMPGRFGRYGSALLAALAWSIRPQTVLFWPAIAFAVGWSTTSRGRGRTRVVAALLGWVLALSVLSALTIAPLALAGVLDDFLRNLREAALGGTYNRVTVAGAVAEFARQLRLRDLATVGGSLALLSGASASTRRTVLIWLVALAGVMFYRPLSPCPHAYLDHPGMLVAAMNLAGLSALLLEAGSLTLPATYRLASILAVLAVGGSLRPTFANPAAARDALPFIASGLMPDVRPLGYRENPEVVFAARYPWRDYCATLDYLRTRTTPETRVANVLIGVPALTGPADRLPALPAESVAWLMVNPAASEDFARALEALPADSVVVWSPAELAHDRRLDRDFALPDLEPVIRRHYQPEVAFGLIEIWRRHLASDMSPRR